MKNASNFGFTENSTEKIEFKYNISCKWREVIENNVELSDECMLFIQKDSTIYDKILKQFNITFLVPSNTLKKDDISKISFEMTNTDGLSYIDNLTFIPRKDSSNLKSDVSNKETNQEGNTIFLVSGIIILICLMITYSSIYYFWFDYFFLKMKNMVYNVNSQRHQMHGITTQQTVLEINESGTEENITKQKKTIR